MPELRNIVTKRCPVSFEWEEETINLAYRPYSEQLEQEARGEDGEWDAESIKALLTIVLIDWDITSDGQPVPITLETLKALPTELVFAMFYVVLEDVRSPKVPKTISRSGSPRTASSDTRPTGS